MDPTVQARILFIKNNIKNECTNKYFLELRKS